MCRVVVVLLGLDSGVLEMVEFDVITKVSRRMLHGRCQLNDREELGELVVDAHFARFGRIGHGQLDTLQRVADVEVATGLPTLAIDGERVADHRLDYFSVDSPDAASLLDVFVDADPGLDIWVRVTDKDKNVMPYELQDYIMDNVPGMSSVVRYGGDIDMLKRFVAAGFPVVVEKGIYELDVNGKYGWMGHYAFVTDYDDTQDLIIYQDTYQPAGSEPGPNRKIKTSTFLEGWRAFNYLFTVVYPSEKESEVMALLGPLADDEQAARQALMTARMEAQTLEDIDQYFAWFNVGTSHVALFEYADAAIAYDYAFTIYANLDTNDSVRPYRMMWYQTGPYKAYYYTNRFADVINLANTTLNDTIAEPVLEESLYWRGQAYYMTGQTDLAVKDYRDALKVHPKWIPATQALQDLGMQP